MPKAKFDLIYKDLKSKIERGEYGFLDMLPSESNEMLSIYGCTRNTIRRALSQLAEEGYIQSIHGKGIQVIYRPIEKLSSTLGGVESFHEFASRNHKKGETKVLELSEQICNEKLSQQSGFPVGSKLYRLQRLRLLDGKPLILDLSYFLKSEVGELTVEIASVSVYTYLEETLGMQIVTSKRQISVEHTAADDEKYLALRDYNCVAVIRSQSYNTAGVMFEYTESRHCPDFFGYTDTAIRSKEIL